MPTWRLQGLYSRDALKGMMASPEDRTEVVSKPIQRASGRLVSCCVTFGEYDYLLLVEALDEIAVSACIIAAVGGVADFKTTLVMSGCDAMQAFSKAQDLAKSFRSAGQSGS